MSSIDMSQFHEVFFEESFEGLDIMETGLMELDLGEADAEEINTIFRAAHSIKGGAGTFGFKDVADFTHVMETLLDEMRAGDREVTRGAVDLLLSSVDFLREMLSAVRDQEDIDQELKNDLQNQLNTLLAGEDAGDAAATSTASDENTADSRVESVWEISFKPHPHLFKTGNDPVRMFKELQALGELEVTVDSTQLPPFGEFDPEESLLSWAVKLTGECSEDDINEVFEWVDEDCDLDVKKVAEFELMPTPPPEAEAAAPVEAVQETPAPAPAAVAEAPKPAPKAAAKKPARAAKASGGESSSIRVGIDKVDALINMVGELVITQSMLSQIAENFNLANLEKLRDGVDQLERNTRELQENVMQIRMLPISFSFNRFPRLVRDLAAKLGKDIELKMSGEQTELDKTVMEKIGDPLVHLVRNSLDHGIEKPEIRKAAGKPETGVLHLNAYHEGGNIVIEIADDGAGLNKQKILEKARANGLVGEDEVLPDEKVHELIFQPGFSTAAEVSDVSGRGVGMDVVIRNIRDLGGVVEIKSEEGVGTTFTVRLPLTLAILDGQLIRVGEHIYIIPLISIVESLQVDPALCNAVAGKAEVYKLRDEYISVIRLHEIFGITPDNYELDKGLLVVAEAEGQKIGIFVDDLLAQQQVVIKSLETNYQKVAGISGATILGDGTVSMILDLPGMLGMYRKAAAKPRSSKRTPALEEAVA